MHFELFGLCGAGLEKQIGMPGRLKKPLTAGVSFN
jgi:hypothetical protein